MLIREARYEEYNTVMNFYYDLIDGMQSSQSEFGWIKDVYPDGKLIKDSIIQNELLIAEINNTIAGAMIINHDSAEGYERMKWEVEAAKDEAVYIHAFGISPHFQKQGIAHKILTHVIKRCKKMKIKAIRLDVLASNKPAQNLYTKVGFNYIGTIQLFYENTGMTDFLLYELVL